MEKTRVLATRVVSRINKMTRSYKLWIVVDIVVILLLFAFFNFGIFPIANKKSILLHPVMLFMYFELCYSTFLYKIKR